MKKRTLAILLGCEAVLCLLLQFVGEILPKVFTTLLAFPYEQIGMGLRALSLTGNFGNLLAIALYAFLCLSPVFMLMLLKKKRLPYPEDYLLILLSLALFATIYFMINPSMLGPLMGSLWGVNMGKAILGGMVYSVLIGYIILRVLRLFYEAEMTSLQKYLSVLLCVMNMLFVYYVFGACIGELKESFASLLASNTGNEQNLGMTYIFLVLKYLVNVLPYGLNIIVVFAALNLLEELGADRYSDTAVTAAEKLSRLCGISLATTILSLILFNILQLVFIKSLFVIKGTIQIPFTSVAFILGVLLLAQYIKENKQLKDDNDMFI
jgi:hypothetical protein